MVSISDSVSAVAGRPARGSLSGWGVGQGRVPGPLAQPVASWPAVSCGGDGPAPRQALCSAARLGLLPDQPALGLSLGWFSPSLPLCPVPAQPSAASPPACLRSSRHPDPQECHHGVKENDRPPRAAALPPASCRLAAESPLPQEPVPISCPLALTPVINIGEGSAGSTHNSEAGWVSLSPPLHPPSQTVSTTLLDPGVWCPHPPPVLGGVEITLLVGCLWHPPCSLRPGPGGESPLFNDWVCLPPPHSLSALQILLPQPLLPCLGNFRPQPNFPSSARPA